jgi:hypothetical protein
MIYVRSYDSYESHPNFPKPEDLFAEGNKMKKNAVDDI